MWVLLSSAAVERGELRLRALGGLVGETPGRLYSAAAPNLKRWGLHSLYTLYLRGLLARKVLGRGSRIGLE